MKSLIKKTVSTAALITCFIQSTYALSLDEIGSKFQDLNSHSVLFTQEKYLKDAELNLESSGKVISAKDKGILIRQSEPYQMELVVKKDSITEYSEGESHTIKADDNPAVHSLLNLLLKLMHPDDELKKDFDYKLEGSKDSFILTLCPKDSNLKNFFEEIKLNGTRYIDKLVIKGAHGDVTTMKFKDYDFSDKALAPEDLKYFD